ncbi:LuxR C-terminal-related transcriptional regulator [Flavobacterium sp. U410]
MKNEVLNIYSEVFESLEEYDNALLQKHIEKHLEIDDFLPAHNSYFIVTNTTRQNYPFVGKGFHANLGLDPEKMKTEGTKYWHQFIHPDDAIIWVNMMHEMMRYTLQKVSLDNRKNLTYGWNFRIRTIWGNYKTIYAHTLPVVLDEEGKPVVGVTQHTIIGEGNTTPIIGTIKILNEKNQYETLLTRNFSNQYFNSLLTKKELEIFEHIKKGFTSKEIGELLFISRHTVDTHRRKILKKTKQNSFNELKAYTIEEH